jgi:hypothetical protein
VNPTAFGVLALRSAEATSGNARSASWLREHRNSDGGWGFAPGAPSDADSTGAVLQALTASGNRAGVRRGISYLRGAQRPGGGFPLNGGAVNAQSTAYAVQGLLAAGVPPASLRRDGRSPLEYLASVQAGDGHYRYSAASDQTPVWVTAQALLALNGAAFPLRPVSRQAAAVEPGSSGEVIGDSSPAAGETKGYPAASGKGKAPQAARTATGPAEAQPLAPAASPTSSGDGGGIPGWLIALVLIAAVGAGVWGGWVLYRRRLPG